MRRTISQTVKFHARLTNVVMETALAVQDPPKSPPVEEPAVMDKPAPAESQTVRLQELLETLVEQLDSFQQSREQNLQELQEIAIELGVAVASRLLRNELDANRFNVVELVREAITHLQLDEKLRVRLNPVDLEALAKSEEELVGEVGDRVELGPDPKLPRGSCFVSGTSGGLLSSFESRLENIRETLLQGIEYARIERRKPINVDGSLRRFPDRRKLA